MAEKVEAVKGLYPKLLAVMAEVERIPKNGYNAFHKYKYVLEADLAEHMRALFIKNRLMAIPTVTGYSKEGEIGTIRMAFTIIDVDSPTDSVQLDFVGEGQDKTDKSSYKAMTGAEKYFLLKTFMIPTGDDPEQDDPQKDQKPQVELPKQQPVPEQKKQEDPKPFVALAISHLAAIDKCKTIAALKSFWLKHEAEVREMPKELSDKVTAAKEARKKSLTPADSK